MYTAAPLKRVVHPPMRWVGEAEEVRVETDEEVRSESVGATDGEKRGGGEGEDIKEQIRMALQWVAGARKATDRGGQYLRVRRRRRDRQRW